MKFSEKEVRECYRFLDHDRETEIRIIDPTRKNHPKSIWVRNEDDFVNCCKKYNERYNIYAGINERTSEGREKKNVISVKTIVLDIDAVREKGFEKEPATDEELKLCEQDCDEIILNMIKSGTNPPTKIFSGNGYQIWISIPRVDIYDDNRDEIEYKLQKFQDLVKIRYENKGSIDKIGDLPRIIKVWGTWNIKGTSTPERPHRLAKIISGGLRNEDKTTWNQINTISTIEKTRGGFKDEDEDIKIIPIEELEDDFIPYPIKYLLYEYEHKNSENWMRIIETFASFLRGIGLDKERVLSHIIKWSRKQPYREEGEEKEIYHIVNRIFKNKINCPNFEKLIDKEEGYPFFGLKRVFENVDLGEGWREFKNPIKYYHSKKERFEMNYIDRLKQDVTQSIALRKKDKTTELLVKHILEGNHIYTTRSDIQAEVWIYQDGVYNPNAKTYIKEICRKVLGESYSNSIVTEVINKIETETYIDQDEFFNSEDKDEIPVLNGILNIKTRELSPFNPKKIFFNKLPVEYKPEATCPNIEKFFKDILRNEEDSKVMFELIGFSLFKDYTFEKAFMFIGNGRNGKGKTLLLIKRFLGAENCAGVPLSLLTASSTSVCELHGRLVNLAGDLSNTDLKETGMFKALTGRDLITAKRKYLRDLFFTNYAKMVFACNELPRVYDLSVGFWSRWVLLEFPYEFVKKEIYDGLKEEDKKFKKIMDEEIIDKISTPEELSGLLNKALDSLDELFIQRDFSTTSGTKEVKDFWIRKSDSFTAFCMDNLEEDSESYILKKEIRSKFAKYCKEHKLKGASDRNIKSVLEDMFGVTDSQKNVWDKYEWVWEGIKWKK